MKKGINDEEKDPLIGSMRDEIVPITNNYHKSSTPNLRGHIATLTAARKWLAVSKLWFTGTYRSQFSLLGDFPSPASFLHTVAHCLYFALCTFAGDERVKARSFAGGAIFLSVCTTLLLLKISSVQSNFNSALSEKQADEFYAAVWGFVNVILVAAPLFALNDYIDSRIAIEWRSWMARRLIASYLGDRAYFRLKIDPTGSVDNPDQRICDDVRSFASSSVLLAVGVLRQLFYCVAFSGLLASLAPGLVGFLLAYAVVGTWVTAACFGRPLTALAFHVLEKEANLRFDLVRVRENAESVAFYGADGREARTATKRLESAVAVRRRQAAVHAWLSLWQNIYGYATILVPSLLMAPKYFAGEVRFGTITQVSFAFNRIESALSYVINHLAALSSLAAETERLDALLGALAPGAAHGVGGGGSIGGGVRRVEHSTGPAGVTIQSLTLSTPHKEQLLCRDLSFTLSAGQSLLIVGPSGCGKSSIMRAVAGLWSVGSGTITIPTQSNLFFLPQKPYMPLGTLQQQLCFPDDPSTPVNSVTEDAGLIKLLDVAYLPDLLHRVGGLDAECDWAHMLSLGEQQRVAFLRLLRRQPAVAFLDEATSGVDASTERRLYEALRAVCPCFVSIGHRKELLAHHTHVLEATGDGRWAVQTAEEYAATTQPH